MKFRANRDTKDFVRDSFVKYRLLPKSFHITLNFIIHYLVFINSYVIQVRKSYFPLCKFL